MFRIRLPGRSLLSVLAALFALFVASPALAQTQGAIRISVIDPDGLPVPSATVTLTGEQLIGGAQERPTDGNGEVTFSALPLGNYDALADHPSFSGVTVRGILVTPGSTNGVEIQLRPAGEIQEFEVTDTRDPVDVSSTEVKQTLSREMLQRLPTGRSYQSALDMSVGVSGQGGNKSIGGGATNENTYMLDGANITDPVTGTFSVNFNFDAIEQLEILLGGYMPEYGQSLGGIVNINTRSGTNNLEFSTAVYYQNGNWRPRMDSRYAADGLQIAPTGFDSTFEIIDVAALVAGPLVRDKAWFIISYQAQRSVIANTGVPQTRDYDAHYVLSKLTVQPSAEHRFTGLFQLDPTSIDNIDQGDPFQKAESQGRQAQGGFLAQGKWQWFIGKDVNLDTTFNVQKSYIEVASVPCTHDDDRNFHPCEPGELEGNVDWETPGRIGLSGAFNSVNYGFFTFDDRWTYSSNSKLSLVTVQDPFGGVHDIKMGVGSEQLVWDQIQGSAGNLLFLDINDVPFDPNTFKSYYWIEYSQPSKFRTSGSRWNAFIQDSWKPVGNLTINYGLRFDNFLMRNDQGVAVMGGNLLGPRLFAAWDPFSDQRTKIATGYGRFNDAGRLGTASALAQANFGAKFYFGEYIQNYGYDFPAGIMNYSGQFLDFDPATNFTTVAPRLRTPLVDEVILNLEREVIEDFAIKSHLTGRFTRYQYEYDETNLIYDSDGSAVIGSRIAQDTQLLPRVRTPLLAKRDYFRWDLIMEKVRSRRWEAQASYSYSTNVGSTSRALSGSFINSPQTEFNYGPLLLQNKHQINMWGYWDLPTDPWTQTIGLVLQYDSGLPEERLYFAENQGSGNGSYSLRIRPRGTYYTWNDWWSLSLRFQQTIDVRKGSLLIDFTAQNLLNNRAADFYNFGIVDRLNRIQVLSRQPPLRFQLGLRYNF